LLSGSSDTTQAMDFPDFVGDRVTLLAIKAVNRFYNIAGPFGILIIEFKSLAFTVWTSNLDFWCRAVDAQRSCFWVNSPLEPSLSPDARY